MKISYKVLQTYIPDIEKVEEIAQKLIMHTAEVEKIHYEGEHLREVYIGEITHCQKHPEAQKLHICKVEVHGVEKQIICGAPNVKAGIKVPVAIIGAQITPELTIRKTKIRGEISEGMICSEDELGLTEEKQIGILELPSSAPLGLSMRDYLGKNDAILEIDNKAINHRPDLFSHIGIIREIEAIKGKKFDYQYPKRNLSNIPNLGIKNSIPEMVRRYIAIQVNNVKNIDSPQYIQQVLSASDTGIKGLLIDITNYSLFLYGQPTHCFDFDQIKGTIHIRKAKQGEIFLSLKDIQYELSNTDIVIADDEKILALGGIIGGKESAVSNNTKNIIIESAHFDQATIRKTARRLGIRTESLNVFEKDIQPEMNSYGANLILNELEKHIKGIEIIAYTDSYPNKQKPISLPFNKEAINKQIGKNYTEKQILTILSNLGIQHKHNTLHIPFWRKEIEYIADIAEEIARIDGYNNIESTIPKINLEATLQDNTYKLKKDSRNFLIHQGFFDMYSYSFVNEKLMDKVGMNTKNLIPLKNPLTEELTHLRPSLIPNLLSALEAHKNDFSHIKLFEIDKIFHHSNNTLQENDSLGGIHTTQKEIAYYETQNIISRLLKHLNIQNFFFETAENIQTYAHSGRTAKIIVRGQEVGSLGEIKPKIANRFEYAKRIGFFEIDIKKLSPHTYHKNKLKEISDFQANHFDLSFVVQKTTKGKDIKTAIEKTNPDIIKKVELFDIFESKQLAGKRSLSFKIHIQSLEKTLDDSIKNELIQSIIKKVETKGGKLRNNEKTVFS